MIPRAILPRVVADSQLPTHNRHKKCAPYIHFSCTNTNGFIQGNMLNTPQAVPLICKASVVQGNLDTSLHQRELFIYCLITRYTVVEYFSIPAEQYSTYRPVS